MPRLSQKIGTLIRQLAARHPAGQRKPIWSRLTVEALEDRCLLTGSAVGIAFMDGNGNGIRDANESVLQSEQVQLLPVDAPGASALTATTNSAGAFSFSNVPAGTYQIGSPNLVGGGALLTIMNGLTTNQNAPFAGLASGGFSVRMFLASSGLDAFPFTLQGNRAPVASATPLEDITLGLDSPAATIDLASAFTDPDITNTLIQFDVTGPNGAETINAELFDQDAPATVVNFLDYVKSGDYDNTIFHRLSAGFVLQGGGFDTSLNPIPENPAVPNEFTGLHSNTIGTLAMAKVGNDPNSATNQFFFNLGDNSANLDVQNGGFTVFGQILGSSDQAVLNDLTNTTAPNNVTVTDESAFNSAFNELPLINYSGSFPVGATASNFDVITNVSIVQQTDSLTYSVLSVTPDSGSAAPISVSITDERLTLTPTGTAGGATVTVRATDQLGAFFDESFHVAVPNNHVPTATGNPAGSIPVAITPASPDTSSTLTATANAFDEEGLPVTLNYVWTKTDANGNAQVIQSGSHTVASGTVDTDTLNVALSSGEAVSVSVTPGVQAPFAGSTVTLSGATALATTTVNAPTIALSPTTLVAGTVGVSYAGQVSVSGGTAPYTYSVGAGALPTGLSLDPSSGAISGTPTADGTFNFTVTATDSSSSSVGGPFSGGQAYTVTIAPATVALGPATLAAGTVGVSYSAQLTASGGTAPYTYSITAGALPPGLSLDPAGGAITGTPMTSNTFNFTITAADSSGGTGPFSVMQPYSVTIS